jgi:hypothetical protein
MHAYRDDSGKLNLVFGEDITVGSLVEALFGLPQDAVIGEVKVTSPITKPDDALVKQQFADHISRILASEGC